MKAEVVLMILNLSCSDPQMNFREFYSRYFVPPGEHGYRWGYSGETYNSAALRELDAIADYAEYRITLATQCGVLKR